MTAFLTWAALRDSEPDPFSWLVIAGLLVLIAAHLLLPRHLDRRADLLAHPTDEAEPR
jgi:uncharacterized membrane protein YhhN